MRYVSTIVAGLLLAGCAGQREATLTAPVQDTTAFTNWAAVEDFDPAPYAEQLPSSGQTVKHDVPSGLLNPRERVSRNRSARGFRIQVLSTTNKSIADQAVSDAVGIGGQMKVYMVYQQPYYRIRIGDFTSRTEAERSLSALNARFPGAHVVADRVVLR